MDGRRICFPVGSSAAKLSRCAARDAQAGRTVAEALADGGVVTRRNRHLPGRSWLLPALLLGLLTGGVLTTVPVSAADWPVEMLDDAELADVFFLDGERGWAVGDRGVIWHTNTGGRRWQRQHSPIECRLESVWFLDAEHGWAVGGKALPYSHKSAAVVLATRDGGRNWSRIAGPTLPALKQVKFLDAARGWAFGNGSPLYPAGVFFTENGGRNWTPVDGLPDALGTPHWLAGDIRATGTGAVAGADGTLALVTTNELRPTRMPALGLRRLHRLKLVGATAGWLVGDGGLIMKTVDGGLSWQQPTGRLPVDAARQFDFHALAVAPQSAGQPPHGAGGQPLIGPLPANAAQTAPQADASHLWVAGSPGSRVWHSPDGGQTWQAQETGLTTPIRALTFVNPQQGWAVGALGTILSTDDGGRTWRRQRAGGTRAALLGLFADPEDVPMELLASLAGNEGYLATVELLARRDLELPPPGEAMVRDRLHQAVVWVGGCGAETSWRYPLRQPGLMQTGEQIAAEWNRANDGQGIAYVREHLVRRLRQWRPDVVLTHPPDLRGGEPLDHLMNQLVLTAVEQAADATSYPEHLLTAGLEPWRVRKVYSLDEEPNPLGANLATAQLAQRLGASLADRAAPARGLLLDRYEPSPVSIGLRSLIDRTPQSRNGAHMFSGILLQPGGEARRLLGEAPAGSLDHLRRLAQRRRNVEQLIERSAEFSHGGAAWLGQTLELVNQLEPAQSSAVLHQLARRYDSSGHGDLSAETLQMLVRRHPQEPLAETALRWLVEHYASGEAAWQAERRGAHAGPQAQFPPNTTPVQPASATVPIGSDTPSVAAPIATEAPTRSGPGRSAGAGSREERARQAIEWGRLLESAHPALAAEPAVGFSLASAYRAAGLPRESERFLHRMTGGRVHDAWWQCAQAELWLAHPSPEVPKQIGKCIRAAERPKLDGLLNEPLWQAAQPIELTSRLGDDAAWPAVALLARDNDYLYLALHCQRAGGFRYQSNPAARTHDADLTAEDRVELLIDLDRDYASYYRLAVDHRGWTAEACCGDASWNPTWYVANGGEASHWTIEAAIPLKELAPLPPAARQVWAVGLQRVVPGVGFQAWTQPAGVEVRPQGFGLLLFE